MGSNNKVMNKDSVKFRMFQSTNIYISYNSILCIYTIKRGKTKFTRQYHKMEVSRQITVERLHIYTRIEFRVMWTKLCTLKQNNLDIILELK